MTDFEELLEMFTEIIKNNPGLTSDEYWKLLDDKLKEGDDEMD